MSNVVFYIYSSSVSSFYRKFVLSFAFKKALAYIIGYDKSVEIFPSPKKLISLNAHSDLAATNKSNTL